MPENKFSPDALKLSQSYSDQLPTTRAFSNIPVVKPGNQEFIRTHSSPEYRLETMVLELKETRETYLADPLLWDVLANELTPKILVLYVNRQDVPKLWPIKLPGTDGKLDKWNESALYAAQHAQTAWIRVSSNMDRGAYEMYEALEKLPDPHWPELAMDKILELAFSGKYIDSLDHPVIQKLKGRM
jgi:hypothetical protein